MKSPLEILQAVLSDPTNPDVVSTLVAHDATFVSLSYYDPELQKIMPWAGTVMAHLRSSPHFRA